MQDGIEICILGQAVLVLLVRAQFGRRWLGQDAVRNGVLGNAEGIVGVPPPAHLVDLGLVEVLEHIVAATHVAVEGGVPDRHLALVAGRQDHEPELVRKRHEGQPPDTRLYVLLGYVRRPVLKQGGEHGGKGVDSRCDRHVVETDAKPPGAVLGILQALPTGVAGGEHEATDPVGPEGVGGHHCRDCRVHTPGKAKQDPWKAGLVHVIPKPQNHGVVDFARPLHPPGDGGVGGRPAIGSLGPAHDADRFLEHGQAHDFAPASVEGEGRPVKHEFILTPHLVQVDHRKAGLGHAGPDDLRTFLVRGPAVGRAVRRDEDLGAIRRQGSADAGGPDVLADRNAKPHTLPGKDPWTLPRLEDAFLVEHAVVGQVALEGHALDLATRQEGEAVSGTTAWCLRRPNHADEGGEVFVGLQGQALDGLPACTPEGRLEGQILGRISIDEELGKHGEVGSGRTGL